ncbi:MAG: type II toxin-antitoxin system RelE/ParE family toxin [Patescibacteria group bacterium]
MVDENQKWAGRFFKRAKDFVNSIPIADRARITAQVNTMLEGKKVYTKQLKGRVRELIVGPYRMIYFTKNLNIYFVNGFRKKGQKTPTKEIAMAEKLYWEMSKK